MKPWLLATGILLVQELVSTNATLLLLYQQHYNLWLIHLIFIGATIFDIWIGYNLGKFLKEKLNKKFTGLLNKIVEKINRYFGKNGKKLGLTMLGLINFPYINAFLVSWLDLNFRDVIFYLFLGDFLWYIFEWLLVFGVKVLVRDFYIGLYVIVGASIVLSILMRGFFKKVLSRF